MEVKYDIYLSSGCHTLPDLSDLPALSDPAMQARLLRRSPGFLGLDLPTNIATNVLQRVQTTHARGVIVPASYRQPKVSVEAALPIAESAIAQLRTTHLPDVDFKPVQFVLEEAMWWQFGAVSDELVEQGYIPGALFASVDKLDGHVWQPEEFERLFSALEHVTYG